MMGTRGRGGFPWGWVGAGAGAAVVIACGAWLALYMSGAIGSQSAVSAPLEAHGTATTGHGAAQTRKFSGQWAVGIECRDKSFPSPLVDMGALFVDQTSSTTATVSYQGTNQPTPAKGEARVVGDQLLFSWKPDAKNVASGENFLTVRLTDPETIEGALKQVLRSGDKDCKFNAKKMTGQRMNPPRPASSGR